MRTKFTKHDEKQLAAYLDKNSEQGILNLLETKGFLFAVASCPDLVMPSEWIPIVLGEKPTFDSEEEASTTMERLMALYNQTTRQVSEQKSKLPRECHLLPDPLKNFEHPSPIHHWSRGFMEGYTWLEDTWSEALEEEAEALELFHMHIFVLGAAANREAFENALAEKSPEERAKVAQELLKAMPKALEGLAGLGFVLRQGSNNGSDRDNTD